MKIWFDFVNTPDINMFQALITELKEEGHEIYITCRPLANTTEMLDLHQMDYTIVGKHYGTNFIMKMLGFPIRICQLYVHLRKQKPDVAVGLSAFTLPLAAYLLGVPCIYTNDNEHAMGNIPAFLFATIIMVPEALDTKKVTRQLAKKSKIVKHHGVKEGMYLWKEKLERKAISSQGKKRVYIRPEPWNAQYYKGDLNFLDDLILKLAEHVSVILIPRGEIQLTHYQTEKFSKITVMENPMTYVDIVKDCDLFIGAGGTMTREMAVTGVPTISVYQDDLLDVDRYLMSLGLSTHKPDITLEYVLKILKDSENKEPCLDLLMKGKEAYNLFKEKILSFEKK